MIKHLYTAKACRQIDQLATAQMGLSETELMQRAASAAMRDIEQHWPEVSRISIYCGPGNNGGDGYLLAIEARKSGRDVRVFALGKPKSGEAIEARKKARSKHIDIRPIEVDTTQSIDHKSELIVDGLFGHGLEREISAPLSELIDVLNQSSIPIFSLDMPSGINSDTGAVKGCALKAQRTISFVAPKLGLYSGEGVEYAGKLSHHSLAITPNVYKQVEHSFEVIQQQNVLNVLPLPGACSHKGNMGRLDVIGGQTGMIGAAILAANAALRSGAGCVTVLSHEDHIATVQQVNPVLMTQSIKATGEIAFSKTADAMVLGPGLGIGAQCAQQASWSRVVFDAALKTAFERNLSLVVDADGLNLLAKRAQKYTNWVLTPHPKEAARLLQCTTADVQADRPLACRKIARRYGGVCVLKGKGSLISEAEGIQSICIDGNWGMATAGAGDVLSGIIGAFLAAGLSTRNAANIAVYVHARAGDLAAQSFSRRAMIASDIIAKLPVVFKALELASKP